MGSMLNKYNKLPKNSSKKKKIFIKVLKNMINAYIICPVFAYIEQIFKYGNNRFLGG